MLSPPSSPFFLPFQGRQYRVSMACPQGSRGAVDLGSFRCDPELSTLLAARGVWDTLRARLAQAEDLEGFVAELTDVLEKVSWQAGGRDRKCDEMLNLSPPTSASYIVAFAFPVYRAFRRTSRHKSCFQLAHNVCQLHKDTDPCFLVPSVVHNTGGVLSATIVASVLSLLMLVPACVHWSVPAHRESLVYAASCRHVGIRHFFSLYRCALLFWFLLPAITCWRCRCCARARSKSRPRRRSTRGWWRRSTPSGGGTSCRWTRCSLRSSSGRKTPMVRSVSPLSLGIAAVEVPCCR